MNYYNWNKILTTYFFNKSVKNTQVFLCITRQDLIRLGKEYEIAQDDGDKHFINTIINSPKYIRKMLLCDKIQYLHSFNNPNRINLYKNDPECKKIYDDQDKYPPYLAVLVFFSLAEMEQIDASSHAYYGKVKQLINSVTDDDNSIFNTSDSSKSSDQMKSIRNSWFELEEWSNKRNDGKYRAYRGIYQKYASQARQNAVLSYSERKSIFKTLITKYDKTFLPNKTDLESVFRRNNISREYLFNENNLNQSSNSEIGFLRDAIYNIVISDFINDLYKNDLKEEKIDNSNNLLLGISVTDKILGLKEYSLFGFSPNKDNSSDDTPIFGPNESIISQIIGQLHSKTSITVEGYTVPKSGKVKIFSKNMESQNLDGNPFVQGNRIINGGGRYIFAVHSSDLDEFDNWAAKELGNYQEKQFTIAQPSNVNTDWSFYIIDNPKNNNARLGIIIHSNTNTMSADDPDIELSGGIKIENSSYLDYYCRPQIYITNINGDDITDNGNYTINLKVGFINKEFKTETYENYIDVKYEDLEMPEGQENITIELFNKANDKNLICSKSFKLINPNLDRLAWDHKRTHSGYMYNLVDIKNESKYENKLQKLQEQIITQAISLDLNDQNYADHFFNISKLFDHHNTKLDSNLYNKLLIDMFDKLTKIKDND